MSIMILKGIERIMKDFYRDSKLAFLRDSIEIRRDPKGFLQALYKDGLYRISEMILKGLLQGWAMSFKGVHMDAMACL